MDELGEEWGLVKMLLHLTRLASRKLNNRLTARRLWEHVDALNPIDLVMFGQRNEIPR